CKKDICYCDVVIRLCECRGAGGARCTAAGRTGKLRAHRDAGVGLRARAGTRALHQAHRGSDLGDAVSGERRDCTCSLCDRDRQAGGDPAGVHEEDPQDATTRNWRRAEDGEMSRKMIPVEESFAAWRKDPEYEKAFNALEDEFALAAAMIEARAHAGLTQQQLAERMHTTQAVIA